MPKFTQIRLVKIQKCDFLNDDILSSFSSGFIAYVVQDGPAFEFADKILQFCLQMKAIGQFFHVMLNVVLYKMV